MARNKTPVEEKYNAPFPTALRTLMEERGETQENIAKAAGKTRQTISQYVNGISEPGYDVLIKIADYFDVSIDYLLGRTGDPSRTPCATDELGLSAKAISAISQYGVIKKPYNHDFRTEGIHGLNLLLADGGLLSLCRQIDRFCKRVREAIDIANLFKATRTEENNPNSEYYKFALMAEEDLMEKSIQNHLKEKFPGVENHCCVLFGNKALEYERISLVNEFDQMLKDISNYEELESHIAKW